MARSVEARESLPFNTLAELYDTLESGLIEPPDTVGYMKELVDYVYPGSDIVAQKNPLEKLDKDKEPRTLVCHDMKGGYLEDRFLQGSTSHDSYTFYYWSIVDTFVYFSHHFVTIPPCGWITTAHRHGVKILGTVITEGSNDTWSTVLASQEDARKFADALVLIAKTYQFEGWLLNIENSIKETDIDNLIYFVNYLTESIHDEVLDSEIIWYDSVTKKGNLSWQNELNDNNKDFFLACDGIFLNYTWTELRLTNSRLFAEKLNRDIKDIYVGLDVWGRGCPGGGGFNSAYALNLIREQGFSVAIFAPGWTHEYFGGRFFPILEDLFWAQLFPYLYVHALIFENEPFKTSFCRGTGVCYYYNGEEYFEPYTINGESTPEKTAFYNLRIQQLQLQIPVPHLQFTQTTQRMLTNDAADDADEQHNDDKSSKNDGADCGKKKVQIERIYENKKSIIRVCGNVVKFENKELAENVNSFEFCDRFSYNGGGCLKLITKDPRSYHRLFLVHIDQKHNIQATVVYADAEVTASWSESINNPILILGNNDNLISILPYDSVRVNSKWRKCTYLTNLKTVNEIGISFLTECECYLGEIVLENTKAS
ncbi:hypothetical protein PUN28_007324 [Cardiocondyla obscurior]